MRKEADLVNGNLFKKLIFYALPIMLSGMLQLFYNAADLIVCGNFGSKYAIAAVSSTTALINLIVTFFLGLSVGANALMARALGEENNEKGSRIAYTSLYFAIVFGIVVGAFGFFMSKIFLRWMDTTEDVIDLSTNYLRIFFLGTPFSLLYNFGSALLRGTGDTKRPSIILLISGLFNVGLNILLVAVFHLDVNGVAIATVLSQVLSALGVWTLILTKRTTFFEFDIKCIKFYPTEAKEIFVIGFPAGLQGAIFSFSNVLIQSSVNSLGTTVVSGNGAANSIEGFIFTAMDSIGQATLAFVSASYGAKNKDNIKRIVRYGLIHVFLVYLIVASIIFFLRKPLLGLYLDDAEALAHGESKLILFALTYFTCGIMSVLSNSIRGINHSLYPMFVVLFVVCGLRIIWIYTIFTIPEFHNLVGLTASYPVSWIFAIVADLVAYKIFFRQLTIDTSKLIEA